MRVIGRRIVRDKNEKIVAITDSISYKMIMKELREKYTFKFFNISSFEAEEIINNNLNHCVGAVGHLDFAQDLNRVLNIDYNIPYGRGRERVHLTLMEGDYVVIVSRISYRASTYDNRGGYTPLINSGDIIFTLAKVVKAPEVNYQLSSLNSVKSSIGVKA